MTSSAIPGETSAAGCVPATGTRRRHAVALAFVIEPTCEVAQYGDWAVMRVSGEIDMATAPRLRQQVQTVTVGRPAGLVLDLDRVDFIDSTGLGVIVGAAKRMRMSDGSLRIVCSQAHLIELFELTRLNEVFDLFETLEDALADVDQGAST